MSAEVQEIPQINSKKYYNVILDSNYQQDLEGTFKMIKQFIKI